METSFDLFETIATLSKDVPASADRRTDALSANCAAVEQVIRVMYKRFDEPLSLPAMAAIAASSPYHFDRVFRQVTGITPGHFLCAIRMRAALHLLLTTHLSVTDVCFRVGYNSLGTFTTRFTRLIGVPPTQLRDFVERAPSVLALLACHSQRPTEEMAPESGICGRVMTSVSSVGCIFVGLFPTAIPQGYPVSCTLLTTPGVYRISAVPDGYYHLFAAGFPKSDHPLSYLMPDYARLQVGASPGPLKICANHVSGRPDITLRAVRLTDPPILPALPLLLAEHCAPKVSNLEEDRPAVPPV